MQVIRASVLGWPTAPFLGRWRGDGGVRPGVLGHQVSVAAQAVAGTLDLHDDRVVQQPIQQRGGDDRIAEDRRGLMLKSVESAFARMAGGDLPFAVPTTNGSDAQ